MNVEPVEEKHIVTRVVEGFDTLLFCRQCNISLFFGLHMAGYATQIINSNLIFRSAIFVGTISAVDERLLDEETAKAKRTMQQ